MHRQIETLRRLAWGNFRDLVLAIASDPAMLVWLDGESSTKEHPNENFARELMELFTCGIGNYTEDDVQEAARAFTGWHRDGAEFAFQRRRPRPRPQAVPGQDGPVRRRRRHRHPDAAPGHAPAGRRASCSGSSPRPSPPAEVVDEAAGAAGPDPARHQVVPPRAVPVALLLLGRPATGRGSAARPSSSSARSGRSASAGPPPRSPSTLDEMGQALLAPPNVKGWDGERSGSIPAPGPPGPPSRRTISRLESEALRRQPRPRRRRPGRRSKRARRGRRPPGRGPPPGRPARRAPPGAGRVPPRPTTRASPRRPSATTRIRAEKTRGPARA